MIETMDASREARIKEILRRVRRHEGEVRFRTPTQDDTWCYRCHRLIAPGDPYRYEVFYLDNDPVETRTHLLSCKEYHHRPRLEASRARIVLFTRGRYIQELRIMSEEQLNEQEQETQDEKPRKKRKTSTKKKSSSKSKSKTSKAKSSSKSKGKKTSTKKAKKEKSSDDESKTRSSLVSTAESLSAIEAFNNRGVATTVKAMAKGETPSNADMVTLRDHVKAEAARLREEGDGSSASQLSSVNRFIRRIERSTR